jgi:hypothetical protein
MRVFILLLLMALIYAPGIAAAATDPSSAPAGQVKELPPELLNLQIAPQEEKKKEKPRFVRPRHESDYMSVPEYERLVRMAIQLRPANFEFTTLRTYYTYVPQYDPMGDTARREILNLAYAIQNEPDQAKRKEAFDKYGEMVSAHLGNIDVMSQALVLAREDKIFGDPKFFDYMRRGLLRSIMRSGDGRNLVHAYDVMTLGEETALLRALQVKLIKTEPREAGGTYYNMHDVQDPKTQRTYTIFVNVSKPMDFLEYQRQNKDTIFVIPRQ